MPQPKGKKSNNRKKPEWHCFTGRSECKNPECALYKSPKSECKHVDEKGIGLWKGDSWHPETQECSKCGIPWYDAHPSPDMSEDWNGKCHNCHDKLICANCNHTPNFNSLLSHACNEAQKQGEKDGWKQGELYGIALGREAERKELVEAIEKMKVSPQLPHEKKPHEGAKEYNHGLEDVLSLISNRSNK